MSIIVIEPECKGWNHEQVNIAWIRMIVQAFPEEKIVFWAEEGHLQAVRKKTDDLAIVFRTFELPEQSGDSLKYTNYYRMQFLKILEQERDKNVKVVLLSSHKGNMKAVLQLSKKWTQCEFYIVMHAVVEQLIKKYSLSARLRGGKFYDGWMLRRVMDQLSDRDNVKFATFSPVLKQTLRGKLRENTLRKIEFIHHPYEYEKIENKKQDGIINIGVMGATVNHYSMQVMEEVGKRTNNDNYVFTVIRSVQDFSGIRNVNLINGGKPVSREQMDEECKKMDYMIIPYDRKMYRLSASGVFFDSINYEIPALMLDSPLLTFYEKEYGVGNCCKTIEELVDNIVFIIEHSVEITDEKQKKMKDIKERLSDENMNYIRKFMDL